MRDQKRQELMDQYDDAVFALLMNEYAEEEGARLRKEFEDAKAVGEVCETPDLLDEKCLRMIHREFARKRYYDNTRKFIKMTCKAAVFAMVLLGVMTMTVLSVNALRVPVLNFIVEHFDEYTSISQSKETQPEEVSYGAILDAYLPANYQQQHYVDTDNMVIVVYADEVGNLVQLTIIPESVALNLDSEQATYSEIMVSESKAALIEKDGYQVIWVSEDNRTFNLQAEAIPLDLIINICNALTSQKVFD